MKQRLIGALCAMVVMGGAVAQTPKKSAAKPALYRGRSKDAATLEFEKFGRDGGQQTRRTFRNEGEEQWKTKRGPRMSRSPRVATWARVGKIEGSYVKMPRYFADADAVMDAERRIVWCMVEKQGFKFETSLRPPSPTKLSRPTSPIWSPMSPAIRAT